MRKRRIFQAVLLVFTIIFYVNTGFAVNFVNNKVITTIHSNMYIFHENNTLDIINPIDTSYFEPFEPVLAQNGDILVINLYASGDFINLEYMPEQSSGIESFEVVISKVERCGMCIIKECFRHNETNSSTFAYKLKDFEEGFYAIKIKPISRASAYKSTTLENEDYYPEKEYFFKVGDVGTIEGHQENVERLYLRQDGSEKPLDFKRNTFFTISVQSDSKIYFDSINSSISEDIEGICYITEDSNEPKTIDIGGYISREDFDGQERVFIRIAYVYKDGCIGNFSQGFINFFD
ncbi:MAG: hypothetical protein IKI57_00990 [Clostridia bacterium]|nr:hypothetical protein [Clostridia bacterium]